METLSSLIPAAATITAALIAAGITFLVSVFTKESKVSEFRQIWIDELRNDISEFLGAYSFVASDLQMQANTPSEDGAVQYLRSMKEEVITLEKMQARIALRLNPKKHAHLIAQIAKLADTEMLLSSTFAVRTAATDALLTSSQELLGKEWGRVKAGELTYRITKWLSLGVVLILILGLILWCSNVSFAL